MSLLDPLPLAASSAQDLLSLVSNGVVEGRDPEFKDASYGDAKEDKREFPKDVTAMANTVGNHIVIGIAEANYVASGEPDLAKRYAQRARIAGILDRVLSAVRIEAATRTVTTWAADGTRPEQDDVLMLIAVCSHVELGDDEPDRTNPARRIGILITPPADTVAQHQAAADGWPLPPLLSMPLRPA